MTLQAKSVQGLLGAAQHSRHEAGAGAASVHSQLQGLELLHLLAAHCAQSAVGGGGRLVMCVCCVCGILFLVKMSCKTLWNLKTTLSACAAQYTFDLFFDLRSKL